MRLACFSSALLLMVLEQQAARAVHLDDNPLQARSPDSYAPLWLNQHSAEDSFAREQRWNQLVQRGYEALSSSASMNPVEGIAEHAQTAAHSPGSDGDGMASHSTAHHHSGRPLSLSQLSKASGGAAAATAGDTTSTNEKAKGKDTGKGGDDQEKKEQKSNDQAAKNSQDNNEDSADCNSATEKKSELTATQEKRLHEKMEEIEKALRKKLNIEEAAKHDTCEKPAKPAAEEEHEDGSDCEAAEKKEEVKKIEGALNVVRTAKLTQHEAHVDKCQSLDVKLHDDAPHTVQVVDQEGCKKEAEPAADAEAHPHSYFAPIGSSKFADTEELKRELEAKQEELDKVKKANEALEKANHALETKKPEGCKGGICAKSLTLVKNGSLKEALKEAKEQADKQKAAEKAEKTHPTPSAEEEEKDEEHKTAVMKQILEMKQKIKAAYADIKEDKKEKCGQKKKADGQENAPKAPKEPKEAPKAPEETTEKPATHACHNKVRKLIQEAVLKVNKPREALMNMVAHELEKKNLDLSKDQINTLEADIETVIDQAKDAKFMHKEPLHDKEFKKASAKATKDADAADAEKSGAKPKEAEKPKPAAAAPKKITGKKALKEFKAAKPTQHAQVIAVGNDDDGTGPLAQTKTNSHSHAHSHLLSKAEAEAQLDLDIKNQGLAHSHLSSKSHSHADSHSDSHAHSHAQGHSHLDSHSESKSHSHSHADSNSDAQTKEDKAETFAKSLEVNRKKEEKKQECEGKKKEKSEEEKKKEEAEKCKKDCAEGKKNLADHAKAINKIDPHTYEYINANQKSKSFKQAQAEAITCAVKHHKEEKKAVREVNHNATIEKEKFLANEREKWQQILAKNRKERHDAMEKAREKAELERKEEEKRQAEKHAADLEKHRKMVLEKAKNEATEEARREATKIEADEKKREQKIKQVREAVNKARELAKAETEHREKVKLAKEQAKEASEAKLKQLQKQLEVLLAKKHEKSLVDLKLDGEPLGRLVLKHGNMYNFDLSTNCTDTEAQKKENMVVDLNIDGKNGPIPKIVTAKEEEKKKDQEKKHKVWADLGDTIESFSTTKEKADAVSGLTEAIKGETAKKAEKKEESSLAQLRAEPSSENDPITPPAKKEEAPNKADPSVAIAAAIQKAKHIPPPADKAAPATPAATPAPADKATPAADAKATGGASAAAPAAPAAPAEKDSKKQADTAPGESGASSPISNMIKSKIANAAAKAKKEGKKNMPQKEAAPKSDNPPASPNKKAAEGSMMEAYIKKTATVTLKTPDQLGPNAKQNSEQAPPKVESANAGNSNPQQQEQPKDGNTNPQQQQLPPAPRGPKQIDTKPAKIVPHDPATETDVSKASDAAKKAPANEGPLDPNGPPRKQKTQLNVEAMMQPPPKEQVQGSNSQANEAHGKEVKAQDGKAKNQQEKRWNQNDNQKDQQDKDKKAADTKEPLVRLPGTQGSDTKSNAAGSKPVAMNQPVQKPANTNAAAQPQGQKDPSKAQADPKSQQKQGDKNQPKPVEAPNGPPPAKPGMRNKIHVLPAPPAPQVLPSKVPVHMQQVQERPLPSQIPPKSPMMSAADIQKITQGGGIQQAQQLHNQAQGLPPNSLRGQQNQFSMDIDAATGAHGPLTPDKGNLQQPVIQPAGTRQQKSVKNINNQVVGQVASQLDEALKIQKNNQDYVDAVTGSKSVKKEDLGALQAPAPHTMMNEMTKLADQQAALGKPVTSARGLLQQSMAQPASFPAPTPSINVVDMKPKGSTPGMTTGGVIDSQQTQQVQQVQQDPQVPQQQPMPAMTNSGMVAPVIQNPQDIPQIEDIQYNVPK